MAHSFIFECINFPAHSYFVVLSPNLSRKIDISLFPNNFQFFSIPYRPGTRVISLKSPSKFLRMVEDKVKPDVVFTTSGPAYWRPRHPHIIGYNLAQHIYLESPFFQTLNVFKRLEYRLRRAITLHYFRRDGDAFVVQTDDINRRLKLLLSSSTIKTVTNTCASHYLDYDRGKRNYLPPKDENEFRLLFLSSYYRHKGFDMLVKTLAELKSRGLFNIRFVLTISKDSEKLLGLGGEPQILNIGPVALKDCPQLYSECDALFLPTLLECFSASYAEAMIMGRPILTSDFGFAKSVCGDAALYFDARNSIDIASKIEQLYKNRNLWLDLARKGSLRFKSFDTAKSRAQKYLDFCENMIKH